MVIKARVNIETARRRYRPGEAITERLSEADLAHFRERNFIIEEDDVMEGASGDGSPDGWPDSIPGTGGTETEADEDWTGFKDETALNRMTKDEIVEYAAQIGLKLDISKVKVDLVSAVLNYTEERMKA
jgi:hypothetical protein